MPTPNASLPGSASTATASGVSENVSPASTATMPAAAWL